MFIKRLSPVVLLALGLTVADSAFAGWDAFEAAFSKQPCQDGWVSCLVGGRVVTPELGADATGVKLPAHLRVGWYDLEANSSFSPFTSLSAYTGRIQEPEPVVAEVAPPTPTPRRSSSADEVVRDPVRPVSSPSTRPSTERPSVDVAPVQPQGGMVRPTGGSADEEGGAVRPTSGSAVRPSGGMVRPTETSPADRPDAGTSSVRPSSVRPTSMNPDVGGGTADDGASTGGSLVRPSSGTPAADPVTPPSPEPENVVAVSTTGGGSVRPTGGMTRPVEPEVVAPVAPVAPVQPPEPVDDSCDNLITLEPAAMMGKLRDGQVACLEASFAAATKPTEKDKISRLLMTNAYSKGDKRSWASLMRRHLEQVDQSDPDLCYKYARYLSRKGPSRAHGVIKWSDTALENRTVWIGDTYVNRVDSLYKMRAAAAQTLWKKAEEDYSANPTPEAKEKVETARNQTKVLAREWLEYAKASGKPSTTAMQLCVSAAGTAEYCEGR